MSRGAAAAMRRERQLAERMAREERSRVACAGCGLVQWNTKSDDLPEDFDDPAWLTGACRGGCGSLVAASA